MPAGGYFDKGHRETPLSQLHTYKAVYAAVQESIDQAGMLKGVLFWRWAGADPTLDLSSQDEATTLGTLLPCLNQSSNHTRPTLQHNVIHVDIMWCSAL